MLSGARQLERNVDSGWSKLGRKKSKEGKEWSERSWEPGWRARRQPGDLWCMKDEGSRLSDYVDRLGDHLLDLNRPGRCSGLFIANCMESWCLNKCVSVPLSCGIVILKCLCISWDFIIIIIITLASAASCTNWCCPDCQMLGASVSPAAQPAFVNSAGAGRKEGGLDAVSRNFASLHKQTIPSGMPTTANASLDSDWRSVRWCLPHAFWFPSFGFTHLVVVEVMDGHCCAPGAQLSLRYDLWAARVFQILQNTENQDWNMPSSAVRSWEMVELLINTENCCNHLEIHSVPAGDSAWTLTKPERCQGVLIAQGLQPALLYLLIAFNN